MMFQSIQEMFLLSNILLLVAFESSMTTPLTIINKDVLVNNTYFTIKIKTINHLFNTRVKLKWNT